MNKKSIAVLAAVSLLPLAGFSQTPPTPPVPPAPAVPPGPGNHRGDREDKLPKIPVTYLGVETSEVPSVVAEQLGLAKGFGLVVDYVVPDGPAAAAGVQTNDILKMFNDQILMEPGQLAKLVRSNADGASVTLTILRKGAETKVTAKLGKREVPQRREMERHWQHGEDFGALGERLENMGEQFRDLQFGQIGDAASDTARDAAQQVRAEIRRAVEEGRRAAAEGRRAAEEARRQAREVRVFSKDNGSMKTTRIDLGKAQVVYSDGQGEMKLETIDNQKVLTAKDPQGRLLFSGPVGTPDELNKVPADVRSRYEKLEQHDLPGLTPNMSKDSDNDTDMDDGDDDSDDDNGGQSLQNISTPLKATPFPSRRFGVNTILI